MRTHWKKRAPKLRKTIKGGHAMITAENRVIKVSFYYDPKEYPFPEDVRNLILDTFGSFNVYDLRVKEGTIVELEKKEK